MLQRAETEVEARLVRVRRRKQMDGERVEKGPPSGYMIPVLMYRWEELAHSALYSFAVYRFWAGVRLPCCVLPSPFAGNELPSVHA